MKKPRQPSPEIPCLNCNTLFDPSNNRPNSCHYHLGRSEYFAEDDYDEFPYPDTWGRRLTEGYAFQWHCCEEKLEEHPSLVTCGTGLHRADGERLEYAIWRGLKDSGVA